MTGKQGSTHVPRGFHSYVQSGVLIIACPHCKRRWRGDRIVNDRNKEYLYSHLDDHRHTKTLIGWQLGIPPSDD